MPWHTALGHGRKAWFCERGCVFVQGYAPQNQYLLSQYVSSYKNRRVLEGCCATCHGPLYIMVMHDKDVGRGPLCFDFPPPSMSYPPAPASNPPLSQTKQQTDAYISRQTVSGTSYINRGGSVGIARKILVSRLGIASSVCLLDLGPDAFYYPSHNHMWGMAMVVICALDLHPGTDTMSP